MAAGLSGFLAMRYAIRGTVVVLPDLSGTTIPEASESLRRIGLLIDVLAMKPDPRAPANTILQQDPIAGSRVKPNQMVRVIVSSGERKEAVPSVVGSSLRVAQMNLMRLGHRLGDVCRVHYGPEQSSRIVYQIPQPGESPGSGIAVHVLFNLGEQEKSYVMPDLVGRDVNEAIRLFNKNQLKIETVNYRRAPGSFKGIILAQQPRRGYRLYQTSPIILEVSR